MRAEAAARKQRQLEKRLSNEIKVCTQLLSQLTAQQELVQGTLAELEATDIIYKSAITELHDVAAKDAEASSGDDAGGSITVEKLLAGDVSCVSVDLSELAELEKHYEVSAEEKAQIEAIQSQFQTVVQDAAKAMFGKAQARVKELLEHHQQIKHKCEAKRKKVDPASAAAASTDASGAPAAAGGVSSGVSRPAAAAKATSPGVAKAGAGGSIPSKAGGVVVAAPQPPPAKPSGDDVRAQARCVLHAGPVPEGASGRAPAKASSA